MNRAVRRAHERMPRPAAPRWPKGLIGLLLIGVLAGCGRRGERFDEGPPPEWLSAYGLFRGAPRDLRPARGVIPYDVNTPLFSDYAGKVRLVRLPEGTSARYDAERPFLFPVGTVIAKTFTEPLDHGRPARRPRLIETRILLKTDKGWVGLPYVWDEDQRDARLRLAGGRHKVHWTDAEGAERSNRYLIPNANQCKGCHRQHGRMRPIGPTARQLNREFPYPRGVENQLAHWRRIGALEGAPPPDQAPRMAVWDDPASGNVAQRARAWLDANCAHCHNPGGAAATAGINLLWSESDPVRLGVRKYPTAAGRGSGGLLYDILPGRPDESILVFRIASTEPQIMMPELGRQLVHTQGVALIRQWIEQMPPEPK